MTDTVLDQNEYINYYALVIIIVCTINTNYVEPVLSS